MANDNETIQDIVREMRRDAVAADAWCETHGEMASAASVLNRHADRIEKAHSCDVAGLKTLHESALNMYVREVAETNRLRAELAAKDAEIARLNEKLILHDCWADEECEDADAARTRAELEVEELRKIVKELADIVYDETQEICRISGGCKYCKNTSTCNTFALVARARKMIGGAK